MSTATELASTGEIRNRSNNDKNKTDEDSSTSSVVQTAEDLLVEKLDLFISSIESRLDNFERFFKLDKNAKKEQQQQQQQGTINGGGGGGGRPLGRSRRSSSTSSLQLFRDFSINNLNMVYERLGIIKKSVLSNSFNNLEYLSKVLADQYNYLFSSLAIDSDSDSEEENNQNDNNGTNNNNNNNNNSINIGQFKEEFTNLGMKSLNKREILSQKIITTIQYFDEKLIKIDDFIKENKPSATDDYTHDIIFSKLRYFNFNRALQNSNNRYLHYYELPLIWRENKYIINGYRFSLSHILMLKLIFHFNHNESMNIWSHLIGLIIIIYICINHFPNSNIFQQITWGDNLIMYMFLFAAIKCLINSSLWHTFSCFAHYPTRQTFACVDYTGITVLITCSIISVEYCSLYNYPKLLMGYMIFSTLCGLAGFIFNWSSYFDKPECRSIRIGFFLGLSFSGATAMICKSYYEGIMITLSFFSPLLYKSFIWYLIGVGFYGGLIPERWRYDIIIEENHLNNRHTYKPTDVILEKMGHDGEDEMEEIEEEFEEIVDQHISDNTTTTTTTSTSTSTTTTTNHDIFDHDEKFEELIAKHFKPNPINTPYANNFLSLWWVDYFLASHNIWHICVVLGILGHYVCLLDMFRGLEKLV